MLGLRGVIYKLRWLRVISVNFFLRLNGDGALIDPMTLVFTMNVAIRDLLLSVAALSASAAAIVLSSSPLSLGLWSLFSRSSETALTGF